MKSKLLFLSLLVGAAIFTGCGNSPKVVHVFGENKTETTEVVEEPAETPAEKKGGESLPKEKVPMSIEISDKEPCAGGSFILTIIGGVPFDDERTLFKIELSGKESDRGKVYPRKFVKKEGDVYKIEVGVDAEYNTEHKLIVTDAAGTQETIDITICYCA